MQKKSKWTIVLGGLAAFLVVFLAFGAVTVAGWEYSNSNDFCASACHAVHPEEPYAHQQSHHAEVDCVECHIGRIGTFASFAEKSGHIVHAWSFLFGYERPIYAPSFGGAQDSCEGCHTRNPHRHDVVNVSKRFSTDRRNTEKKLTLTMRLNGREVDEVDHRGVNWHASGAVRFIADDPQNLRIRWVEATLPDGSKRTYSNVTAPITADEIKQADVQVMDCGDCHNRAGHPFRNPEEEVDMALIDGRLDPDLPFIKARMVELLEKEFDSEDEANEIVRDAWSNYQEEYPDLAEQEPEAWQAARRFLDERQGFMVELMIRNRFVGEGVSWRSFPDHNGHKLDPGCFRCHSGRLQDAEGTPITANCTNCHSIPLITKRDRIPDYFLALLDMKKPDHHRDPAFISKHMDMAGEECTTCHEEIRYGASDRSYCSNSGCHGEVWEFLDLEAMRKATRIAGHWRID